MYLYCITSFNMKTTDKLLTVLVILSFILNVCMDFNWHSWNCWVSGVLAGWVATKWSLSNKKEDDHA